MANHAEKLYFSVKDAKQGNHRVENHGAQKRFIYFDTIICVADTARKVYYTTTGGWDTQSTKCAIGRYRNLLNRIGYEEVTEEQFGKK